MSRLSRRSTERLYWRGPRADNGTMIERRAFLGLVGAAGVSSLLLFGRSGTAAPALHFALNHAPAEWRQILGPDRYAILREGATERPFTSPLLKEHRRGTFVCAA